jgi:hypothetical protein
MRHSFSEPAGANKRTAKLVVCPRKHAAAFDGATQFGDSFDALSEIIEHATQIEMSLWERRERGRGGDRERGRRR